MINNIYGVDNLQSSLQCVDPSPAIATAHLPPRSLPPGWFLIFLIDFIVVPDIIY